MKSTALKTAVIVLAVALYALASHFSLILPGGQQLATVLALVIPALAVTAWLAQIARARLVPDDRVAPGLTVLCFGVAALLVLAPLWWAWPLITGHADHLYFAQHLGMNALMAWVFGHTLMQGKTPLVVRLARMTHKGALPSEVEAYAHKTTWAWVWFFVLTCVISVVLFLGAPIAWWSAFGVLLQWPSVFAFLILEYAYRRWRFRGMPHASLREGFEAWQQHQKQRAGKAGS
jgi:uncharacterized membrane protein